MSAQPKISKVDWEPTPENIRAWEADEHGYRRGYDQGYAKAVQDVFNLKRLGYLRPQEIANILASHEVEIHRWRLACKGRFTFVPTLKQEPWSSLRDQVFERDGRICQQCGATDGLQIDHIREVKRGGLPKLENLRVLCGPCNLGRNAGGET